VPRRTERQSRVLGLWTAGWLFVLLLAGLLRFGDVALQWPALLVPVLWAGVALRPRGPFRAVQDRREEGAAGTAGADGPLSG
jgi:hypothetical protein